MDTFKQVKDSVLNVAKDVERKTIDAARDVEQKALDVAKDVERKTIDVVRDVEQKAIDVAKDFGERAKDAKDRVMGFADKAIGKVKGDGIGFGQPGILGVLKEDHELVSSLFEQIEAHCTLSSDYGESAVDLFTQLKFEIETHSSLEEKLFYSALQRYDDQLIKEALTEHALVKTLLSEISSYGKSGPDWFAKVKVLKENVQHHVDEEESKIFSFARANLSDTELNELGIRMEQEKLALTGDRVPTQDASSQQTDRIRGGKNGKGTPRTSKKSTSTQHQGWSAERRH